MQKAANQLQIPQAALLISPPSTVASSACIVHVQLLDQHSISILATVDYLFDFFYLFRGMGVLHDREGSEGQIRPQALIVSASMQENASERNDDVVA